MKSKIPGPSVTRLCTIYQMLGNKEVLCAENDMISSKEIGRLTSIEAHTIRKDINYLGEVGRVGSGYNIKQLRSHIRERLNLNKKRNACIVGLGRLGSAILDYRGFKNSDFRIIAAFDSNINKIETLTTSVELFPAYEISEAVKRKEIELGIITVPESSAQETADRLIAGGVHGIVNFSPAVIKYRPEEVAVKNIDIIRELSVISALSSGYIFEKD